MEQGGRNVAGRRPGTGRGRRIAQRRSVFPDRAQPGPVGMIPRHVRHRPVLGTGYGARRSRRSSLLDEARLPFTMSATVSYGGSPPGPSLDQLPADWVRLPVSFQVTLPAEVMEGAAQAGASAGSGQDLRTSVSILPHAGWPGVAAPPDDGRTWQDQPASPGAAPARRDDARPIGPGTLNSLGLGAAFRQRLDNRPARPASRDTAGAAPAPAPPDVGTPNRIAAGGNHPASGTGRIPGSTGHRALDAVFSAGTIGTPPRVPPAASAPPGPADAGG